MAIEIKELVVKFTVEEPMSTHSVVKSENISREKINEIIDRCTEAVLDKLNKYDER